MHPAVDAALRPAIDAVLRQGVESGQIPGVVAMATDGRDTLYEGAFGVRRLGDPAAMTADTVFWIASMTKAVTSVACMQLVEQGRIGLHDPLGAAVPKLARPQVLEGFDADGQPRLRPARREVTLHDLLTHTSGFVYEGWNPDIGRYQRATGRPGIVTGLNAALEMPLAADPGERWEYGIGTDWAGKVVEAVSGQTLGGYFAEHITGPLGMVDTRFGAPVTDRLVSVHVRDAGGALHAGSSGRVGQPELESGGGGLYSTAPDYLRFLAALLRRDGTLLRPETVATMARNQIDGLDTSRMDAVLPAPPGVVRHWGYGFLINPAAVPGRRSAGSLAWAGLPNCYYWLDPARGVAALIMMQILPFADPGALDVLGRFESALYAGLPPA